MGSEILRARLGAVIREGAPLHVGAATQLAEHSDYLIAMVALSGLITATHAAVGENDVGTLTLVVVAVGRGAQL